MPLLGVEAAGSLPLAEPESALLVESPPGSGVDPVADESPRGCLRDPDVAVVESDVEDEAEEGSAPADASTVSG